MKRFVLWVVFMALSVVGESGQPETGVLWPQRWRLESAVFSGELQLSVTGSLLVEARGRGLMLTGSVKGRHIILTRDTAKGREIWAGWLTEASSDSEASVFVAGTVTLQAGEEIFGPWGWYALPIGELEPPLKQPETQIIETSDDISTDSTPPTPVLPPTSEPTPQPAPLTITPKPEEPLGFEGTWHSVKGEFVITREGQKLTIEAPDGWVMRGRITGASSCVVGMGPGCCSGAIEAHNTIRWQDGSVWERHIEH